MPTYANGCDYAFSHPTIPALKAAKLTFACRYLYPMSQKPGTKNLTRDEATQLNAALEHGVVSNYESWASRALDGHNAGIDDARAAQAQHTACGGKMDRPIYFSVDFDAQPAQYAAIRAYMLGVASVIGTQRTGVYGSYSMVKWLLDNGLVKWAWQTYAWSGGRYDERCQLSQDKNGVPLGGAEIDLDTAHAEDFGQWNYKGDGDDMSAEDRAAIIAAVNKNTDEEIGKVLHGLTLILRGDVDAKGQPKPPGQNTHPANITFAYNNTEDIEKAVAKLQADVRLIAAAVLRPTPPAPPAA